MAIYLVQHGISTAKNIDPEKGLSEHGKNQTTMIAKVAKGYAIPVNKVVHSGKKRAEQTAAIYHAALSVSSPMAAVSGINPMDDVRNFATTMTPQDNLMVVGHMPFMQKLLSYLTTGSEEIRVYQFQNSGLVCIDGEQHETDGSIDWFIRWSLNPNIP